MDWRLRELSKDVEDVASGLHIFEDEIPVHATSIAAAISGLFGVSNALLDLDKALRDPRNARFIGRLTSDLDLVVPSLEFTLGAVREMFGKSSRSTYPGAFPDALYSIIWDDLTLDLNKQGATLLTRLDWYSECFGGLVDLLHGEILDNQLEPIRARLRKLLRKQEPLDERLDRLSIDPQVDMPFARTRTPSASRPPLNHYATYPTAYPAYAGPPYPGQIYTGRHPGSPISSEGSWGYPPPLAPEVPHSPTNSTSSSTTYFSTSFSTDSNGVGWTPHWALKVFDGRHGSSSFGTLGQTTRCFGRHEPTATSSLDAEGYVKVLELPFEATNAWVRLYWRPRDYRARILFMALDEHRRPLKHCLPLTALKVMRADSCLRLCRVNRQDGKLDLWANLRFTLYERMVLFYCTVVAMKRQDSVQTPQGLEDYFPGEVEEFGGEIEDDHYLHAFRVFRDRDSDGVRFETTARRGPMQKIPIWTAFVTQYIGSRTWIRRANSTTVLLRELNPYVFCEKYAPPRDPVTGMFQLKFTNPDDARYFVEVFQNIKTR